MYIELGRNLEIFAKPLFYFMDRKQNRRKISDLFQVIVQASSTDKIRIHDSSENTIIASHLKKKISQILNFYS